MTEPERAEDALDSLSSTVARLRRERDGLRRAMQNRAVIEQAKGILAERLAVSPEEAFGQLTELSMHSNVKVAELAAALVAGRAGGPEGAAPEDMAGAEVLYRLPNPPNLEPRPYADLAANIAEPSARQHLLAGRVEAARTYDEIADAIAASTLSWPAPATVVIMLLEADGALRLAGASGLDAEARSRWSRVPPIQGLPMVEAVRRRMPVLLTDSETLREDFPTTVAPPSTQGLVALPLIHDGTVLGVMEMFWERPYALDDESRAYLLSVAAPIASRCVDLFPDSEPAPGDGDVAGTAVLKLVLEALAEPVVLLAPIHGEHGRIVDFRPEAASPAARELIGDEDLGTDGSLLTFFPRLAARGLLSLLTEVAEKGEPRSAEGLFADAAVEGTRASYWFDVHATRLWDMVLATCRIHSEADVLHDQLLLSEELAGTGSFHWDLSTGKMVWSPGMYRLLGHDPGDGPLPPAELDRLVDPEDLVLLAPEVGDAFLEGRTLTVELRGAGPVEGRRFEITAVPHRANDALTGVSGTCRDVSGPRVLSAAPRPA